MKQRPEIIGEKVELLGLHSKVSAEEMESAGVQALNHLQAAVPGVEEEIAETEPVRPVRRPQWIAVGTIAAAIALAVFLPTRVLQSAPAVLEDAEGKRQIQYGELVRARGDMSAMLSITDGPRVEMESESELTLERAEDGGTRIHLNKGGVIVDAAAQQSGNLVVQTKDMTASMSGAVSLVKIEEQGSRVATIGGEVLVQRGTTETKLRSGEQVATSAKMESVSLKEELTWSREAVAHVAMLQQAASKERVAFEVATIRSAAPTQAPAGSNARGGGGQADRSCMPGTGHIQLDPRRFNIRSATLHELVSIAYGPCADVKGRLSGGPDWVKSETWDIEALIPEGAVDPLPTTAYGGPGTELMENRSPKVQKMIRTLVEERFKVAVRREMKEMPVYVLTVAPGGPKFQGNDFSYGLMTRGAGGTQPSLNRGTPFEGLASASQGAEVTRSRSGACLRYAGWFDNPGQRQGGLPPCQVLMFLNQFMDQVALSMSADSFFFADRRVINRTGIQDKVSFAIDWDPGPFVPGQLPQPLKFREMLKALEPVGLQLKEDPKGLVEFFVIERAERPTEN